MFDRFEPDLLNINTIFRILKHQSSSENPNATELSASGVNFDEYS